MAFEEFFFRRARDVYPRYDFARMNDDEYRATLGSIDLQTMRAHAARVNTAVWNGPRLSISSTLCIFTSHLNIRSTILSGAKSAMVKPCCSIGFTSSSMSR